ncbi:sigma-70 family RNA polymerase sigma factor [Candidatus Saccharibacteria bacterium]|nr:sigma-70 family RNA polymerase sigma factor [Candidatus Saccharibacteria bacterium]
MIELENFYESHVDKVYKYFYIQVLNRQIAEDLTSQTFLKFIAKVQGTTIKQYKKYLYGIMRNVFADYLREKYKNLNVEYLEDIHDFEVYIDNSISDYEAKNSSQRLNAYIENLPKKQREVALMRFIEQKSLKETADQLGKNIVYVKTTQYRATKSLMKLIKQPYLGGTKV